MDILEYISESNPVEKLSVEFDGKKINFHIKNLTQAEVEAMSASQNKLIPIWKKQKNDQDLTDEEMTELLAYQSDQAYQVLCKADGSPLYDSKEEMKKKIPGRLFKAVANAITEHNALEDAEKN